MNKLIPLLIIFVLCGCGDNNLSDLTRCEYTSASGEKFVISAYSKECEKFIQNQQELLKAQKEK